jgi:hypothetical protein
MLISLMLASLARDCIMNSKNLSHQSISSWKHHLEEKDFPRLKKSIKMSEVNFQYLD